MLSTYLYNAIDLFGLYHSKLTEPTVKITQMNVFCDTIVSVLSVVTSSKGVPTDFFYLFDKVSYFLLRYKNEVSVGCWTEICHQLLRKCPFNRNEDLLFEYR